MAVTWTLCGIVSGGLLNEQTFDSRECTIAAILLRQRNLYSASV
jgi:hypothetical protein